MSVLNAIMPFRSMYTYAITSPLNNILLQFISFILHKLIKITWVLESSRRVGDTQASHIDFNQPRHNDIEIYSTPRNMDFY